MAPSALPRTSSLPKNPPKSNVENLKVQTQIIETSKDDHSDGDSIKSYRSSVRSDRTFSVKRDLRPNYISLGLEFLEDILMFLEWMKNRIDAINLANSKRTKDILSTLIPLILDFSQDLENRPYNGAGESRLDFYNTFRLLRKELNNDEAVNGKDSA